MGENKYKKLFKKYKFFKFIILIPFWFQLKPSIRTMSSLINRFSAISNSQYLHSKCVGAGNPDMTKHEWILQIRRDSFASYIGHHFLVSYFALSLNQSIGRIKFKLM